MRPQLLAVPLLVLGLAVPPGAPAHAAAAPGSQRVLVQLRSAAAVDVLADAEARAGGRIAYRYRSLLHGFVAKLPPARVAALRRNPAVAAVIPDQRTSAGTTEANPPWGLGRIDQRPSTPTDAYDYDTTGAGVTVYVIDSGIRFSHKEFGGRAVSGYDFVDADPDASDCYGHGTHVAGTIGGTTYGVAKGVRLVSLRVWDCSGSGWQSDIMSALDWVVGHRTGPAVVNISGGGDLYGPTDDAVARATAAGIPVVVAGMNDGADACAKTPADAPSAITVGATDATDARAGFSNFGTCIDLFAPGVDITSSLIDSDTASGQWSGTSMATPHVTGAVARYLQTHPTAAADEVTAALQQAATPGVVTDARSAHDGLLYVEGAKAAVAPSAPAQVAAKKNDVARMATLSWAPPASDGGSPVTGYRVARNGTDSAGTGPWSTTVSATARSFTFSSLNPWDTYALAVQAITAAGAGPVAAASVTLAGSAPSAPTGVSAKLGPGLATVAWTAPAHAGTSSITGYRIRRYAGTGSTVQATATVAATSRSLTVTGLTNGSPYSFDVTAINASGAGRVSARSAAVTPSTVPGAPVIGTAASGSSGGTVTATARWSAPGSTGGSAITGYRVSALRMSSSGAVLATTVSGTQSATSRSLSMTLPVAGSYRFTVQAVNARGSSAASGRSNQVSGR